MSRTAIVCPDCHGCGHVVTPEIGDTCPTCEGVGMVDYGSTSNPEGREAK